MPACVIPDVEIRDLAGSARPVSVEGRAG